MKCKVWTTANKIHVTISGISMILRKGFPVELNLKQKDIDKLQNSSYVELLVLEADVKQNKSKNDNSKNKEVKVKEDKSKNDKVDENDNLKSKEVKVKEDKSKNNKVDENDIIEEVKEKIKQKKTIDSIMKSRKKNKKSNR